MDKLLTAYVNDVMTRFEQNRVIWESPGSTWGWERKEADRKYSVLRTVAAWTRSCPRLADFLPPKTQPHSLDRKEPKLFLVSTVSWLGAQKSKSIPKPK